MLMWPVAFALVFAAVYCDVHKDEKGAPRMVVPNWLNLAGLSAGIILHAFAGDLRFSLVGLAWGLGIGVLFYFFGMGGGDAKLLTALGSIIGAESVYLTAVASAALFVLFYLPLRLRREGIRGFWEREKASLMTFFITKKVVSMAAERQRVPFAPFVAAGAAVAFVWEVIKGV